MTFLAALALTFGLAAVLAAAGYAVVGFAARVDSASRLLAAPLLGLGLLLWTASLVNLLAPLAGPWAYACWWMIPAVLLVPRLRHQLALDLSWLVAARGRPLAVLGGAGALAALVLLPFWLAPDLVFFDGTGNHDSFFWISGASYLQHYTYLRIDPAATEMDALWWARVVLGWQPHWGRMGTEGYLAVIASMLRRDPIEIAIPAMTALLGPWLAAVLALVRAIGWLPRRRRWLATGCFLQSLFLFTLFNGNYPNLLGVIFGGGLLVAAAMAVAPDPDRALLGLLQLPLLLHGVLVSYPEIAPFVGLPAALVVLRVVTRPELARARGWHLARLSLAVGAGVVLNPWTTLRAAQGFLISFQLARSDDGWRNLFADVSPFSYLPGWLTLSIDTVDFFDPWLSACFTALLLVGVLLAWRSARDRNLAAASLAGFAVLAAYTAYSDFDYGWQKSAQFAAVPLAALYPFGVMSFLAPRAGSAVRAVAPWPGRPAVAWILLALLLTPAAVAVWDLAADARAAATRKLVTRPMLGLGAMLEAEHPGQLILVDGQTFTEPFFHSMWASYVCRPALVLAPVDAPADGGYLATKLRRYDPGAPPADAAAYYVARGWADRLHGDIPRLSQDRVVSLLRPPAPGATMEGNR